MSTPLKEFRDGRRLAIYKALEWASNDIRQAGADVEDQGSDSTTLDLVTDIASARRMLDHALSLIQAENGHLKEMHEQE